MTFYCLGEIIPHFYAAGHLPYTKSARLYRQRIESLEKNIQADEFAMFIEKSWILGRKRL